MRHTFSRIIIGSFFLLSLIYTPVHAQTTGNWQKTNGPGTNMVMDMALFNNQLYLGTEGGIYKSNDNGLSWLFVSTTIPYRGLYHLISTSQALVSGSSNGIHRSTDGGNTWSAPLTGGSAINQLAQTNSALFAATQLDHVKRSTDGGLSWTSIGSGVLGSYIAIVESHNNMIFTEGPGKLNSSSDHGATWSSASFTSVGLPSPSSIMSICSAGGNLYVGMSGKGLYQSFNNGASFTAINVGLPSLGTFEVGDVIESGNTLFVGITGPHQPIYKSTDGGQTWVVSSTGMNIGDGVRRFYLFGSKLFASTLRGLYASTDGGVTWTHADKGITNGYVDALAANSTFLFAGTANRGMGGTQSIYRSSDYGQNWQAINQGLSYISTKAIYANDSLLLVSGNNATLFRSINNGSNWQSVGASNNLTANGLGFTKKGNNLFMITDSKGAYKSNDNGITWTSTTNSVSVNPLGHAIYSDSANIYIAAGVFTYYSADDGQTWINTGAISASTNGTALHGLSNFVFLGTRNQGMYKRLKSTNTWTACNNGIPQPAWITSIASKGDSLFVGTDYSSSSYTGLVYVSTDLGASWSPYNQGMPANIGVRCLLQTGNRLVAGTGSLYNEDARSVWCNTLSATTPTLATSVSEQYHTASPHVYPNPNNGIFDINCQDPIEELKLYNSIGETVFVMNQPIPAGNSSIRLLNLPPGIYILQGYTLRGFFSKRIFIHH